MQDKIKQYMIVLDEASMLMLSKLCPSMLFVPVEGMTLQGNETHVCLVTPKAQVKQDDQVIEPNTSEQVENISHGEKDITEGIGSPNTGE